MNQVIPLANPGLGLMLDGVTIESPRPKAAIVTIKIWFVIVYVYLILNFFCLHFNIPLYQTVTKECNDSNSNLVLLKGVIESLNTL
jgi:hypothetical protein